MDDCHNYTHNNDIKSLKEKQTIIAGAVTPLGRLMTRAPM